jgi:antitoxin MazE
MRIAIRRIGNLKGIIIPTALLTRAGLDTEAEVSVEDGALIVRAPSRPARAGWAKASTALVSVGDDAPVLPDFSTVAGEELDW